jgi:hypothetical protein
MGNEAICPKTGELKVYSGPRIESLTEELVQQFCEQNGFGYCKIV